MLADRFDHCVLYGFKRRLVAAQRGERDALRGKVVLQHIRHVFGQVDAHDGQLLPAGGHFILKKLQLHIQRPRQLLLRTVQTAKEEKTCRECKKHQPRQRQHTAQQLLTERLLGPL